MSPSVENRSETRCGREGIGVGELLQQARAVLDRLSPAEALIAVKEGAALIDIRPDSQVDDDGGIEIATRIDRNLLEWRLEPNGVHAIPELVRDGRRVIVLCGGGYASSLAAASLRRMGLDATDVCGGFQAWRRAGMPLVGGPSIDRGPSGRAAGRGVGGAPTRGRVSP